jgi:hypothetical protein
MRRLPLKISLLPKPNPHKHDEKSSRGDSLRNRNTRAATKKA